MLHCAQVLPVPGMNYQGTLEEGGEGVGAENDEVIQSMITGKGQRILEKEKVTPPVWS